MGIIPRISEDIFEHIFAMDENLEFHIKVSVAPCGHRLLRSPWDPRGVLTLTLIVTLTLSGSVKNTLDDN